MSNGGSLNRFPLRRTVQILQTPCQSSTIFEHDDELRDAELTICAVKPMSNNNKEEEEGETSDFSRAEDFFDFGDLKDRFLEVLHKQDFEKDTVVISSLSDGMEQLRMENENLRLQITVMAESIERLQNMDYPKPTHKTRIQAVNEHLTRLVQKYPDSIDVLTAKLEVLKIIEEFDKESDAPEVEEDSQENTLVEGRPVYD